jgi:2-amino-4-hydroxy-6-hydroxymethyldihydropteridine diphosphokinase
MNHVYLLIGGNLGDRQANLARTIVLISERCGILLQLSSVYETAAWGMRDQPDFLNQVLLISTALPPQKLLELLLEIEHELGRFRGEKNGPRVIDIDILLYNDAIIHEPGLQIPHPRMASRRFVLTPLAEIAEELIHPETGKNIRQMLDECEDLLPVNKKSI